MRLISTLLIAIAIGYTHDVVHAGIVSAPAVKTSDSRLDADLKMDRRGRLLKAAMLSKALTYSGNIGIQFKADEGFDQAFERNRELLRRRGTRRVRTIGDATVSRERNRKTMKAIATWRTTAMIPLDEYVEAYQLQGNDRRGNVQYTGYFAPVIDVSLKKTEKYRYPIYRMPNQAPSTIPTRQQIDSKGALKGKGLEICYAADPTDIYYMQVQGSGYVRYRDGSTQLLSYDGRNKHPFKGIERLLLDNPERYPIKSISPKGVKAYLAANTKFRQRVLNHNPSYTFFKPEKKRKQVRGAGFVPLTDHYSIASDRRYLPMGSIVLAEIPVVDENGYLIGHEHRLLFAQDTGGKIKGPGHVDVYHGVGDQAFAEAGKLNHYGRMWMLSAS